ncbi:MAG: OmpA family protein [Gemmatimonadaceae bacterium]
MRWAVLYAGAVAGSFACAPSQPPQPAETRLEAELRRSEQRIADMQQEIDSIAEVRRQLDARIAALGNRPSPVTDAPVVIASGGEEIAPRPGGDSMVVASAPVTQPEPGGGERAVPEADLAVIAEPVGFAFNSAELSADDRTMLIAKADVLRRNDALVITLIGHADARGPAAYNQKLSERRAQAARRFLVSLGIDAARISAEGRGETEPKVEGRGEDIWRQNRRVEFVVR